MRLAAVVRLPQHHLRARQVGLDPVRYGDRARPRTAAAVRLREGLVQVDVDDVEAHVARPRDAHDRVQVGAVVVERRAGVVHDAGDLLDALVEEAERVRVGEHQAGDVLVRLGAQVVDVDAAALVGCDLDHLVAGHRDRRGVRAVSGVGSQHLGALLAAVLVIRARQQQPGKLAVGAGRGLKADVRQPADLGQRPLQPPHQLERALRALRRLQRVQPRVAGQRGDALVQARVVLHRARPERVEAGVEVEVATREPVVVADDLRLRDLGQLRRARSQQVRRHQLLRGRSGTSSAGSVAALRPGCDFSKIVTAASRCIGVSWSRRSACRPAGGRHARTASPTSRCGAVWRAAIALSSTSASRSMSARERRSVIATSRPSANSG